MNESAPVAPTTNPEQPEQVVDPNYDPNQEQLFDPTPLTPEQEHEARVEAALRGADPAVVGDKPIELNAPLSPDDEYIHKGLVEGITKNEVQDVIKVLPEDLRLKRDWSDNEAQHKEKEAEHVAAIAKNLEAKLAASGEATEAQAYREKINTHNENINARETETAERTAAKQAYIEEQTEAAKAEQAERDAVRETYLSRQKLLRGEAQAKLFEKEDQTKADELVESTLGPAKYGKPSEETNAALEAAADEHVEAKLGEAKHADYGVLDIDKLKAKDAEKKEADEKPEAKNIFFEADENGVVQTAVELTREGDGVDLNVLNGGEALLYTEDNTFFVNGRDIDDLVAHANNHRKENDKDDGWSFDPDEAMPTVLIGESLMINGSPVSGSITKIEIKQAKVDQDDLDKELDWQERGADSFEAARAMLDKSDSEPEVVDGEVVDQEPDQESDDEPKGFRARVQAKMSNAAEKLKDLQRRAMVGLMTSGVGEYYGDEEKGKSRKRITGAVLGAVALASAAAGAYVATKTGVSVPKGGGNTANGLAPLLPKPSLGNTIGDAIQHVGKSVEKTHHHAHHAHNALHGHNVAPAHATVMEIGPSTPTVSHMALKDLVAHGNLHPSQQEIIDRTAHELQVNHLTWDDARHMVGGTKVTIK